MEKDPATNSAMDMFKNKDKLGTELTNTKLGTTHQNQIQSMRIINGDKVRQQTSSPPWIEIILITIHWFYFFG